MLKAKKKYSKKELKQDKFIIATMEAKEYLQDNAQTIILALAAVVVIILGLSWWNSASDTEELEAASMLARAQETLSLGKQQDAVLSLLDISEDYSGTTAGGDATFQVAKIYWQDGEMEQAKHYFSTYFKNYGNNDFVHQAALAGYADCLAYEENYAEAAIYYERAAKMLPDFPQAASYQFSAAESYRLAGNTDKARSAAQKLMDDFDNSAFQNKAEVMLKSLN